MKMLWFLICLVFSVSAQASGDGKQVPSSSCSLLFSATSFEDYSRAVQKYELTHEALKKAERRLIEHLAVLATKSSISRYVDVQGLIASYSGAVSTRMRGLTQHAVNFERQLSSALGVTIAEVQTSTKAAAEDRAIYRSFSMAEFTLQGKPTIESLLLQLLMKSDLANLNSFTINVAGVDRSVPFVPGPRQIEMIRSVLQYSQTNPGDNILEIGYGTPGVAIGVAYYTRAKVLAIDLLAPPKDANILLAKYGVELVHGVFPNSQKVREKLRERSQFSVILALDTVKREANTLETTLSPAEFAKTLYSLLKPGGTVVILNDFREEPYFSALNAAQAGFQIIQWGFIQSIPQELRALMPYRDQEYAGDLALTALRKSDSSAIR